ncbi:cyclic AMP-responsive element-binding protein 3-like protein 4, partial [Mustelus asterias]
SLLSQLRRLQCLIKETSNKAAQTSTCIMIMAFSLVLLIFPSYNLIRLENPVNQEEYKPTGVISRTILTDLESSQISELAGSSLLDPTAPVELQEEPVPLADSLVSDSRHQPIVRGNRSGPGTEAEVPGAGRPEDSLVRKTVKNPAPGLQDEPSDAGNPTPGLQPLRRRAPADSSSPGDRESSAKPGHADEM